MESRSSDRISAQAGFTLIEVLITVAILSTSIIFLFRSFTVSLSSAKFSQDITLGCFLAEEKIWDVIYAYNHSLKLPDPAKETLQNKDFNWTYSIADTDNDKIKELKFTVSWKENAREKAWPLEVSTYLVAK